MALIKFLPVAFVLALLVSTPFDANNALALTLPEVRQKAENGDRDAQVLLGGVYWQGRQVPQNYDESFKWFEKAAKQGSPEAQSNVALFYMNGWTVGRNDKKAAQWHRKAAVQGFALSQFYMGKFYIAGFGGVPKNQETARSWFEKASAGGNVDAQTQLGVYYIGKKQLKKARSWLMKAAENDDGNAQFLLGQFYQKGFGGKKDAVEALDWFESAVGNNVSEAVLPLAQMLLKGDVGVDKDETRAFFLLQEAAEDKENGKPGSVVAQHYVGQMLLDGLGTPKDQNKGLEWLEKAATRGNFKSLLTLSARFSKGKGVPQNYKRAYEYILVAERLLPSNENAKADEKTKEALDKIKKTLRKNKKPIENALSPAEKQQAKEDADKLLAEIRLNQPTRPAP